MDDAEAEDTKEDSTTDADETEGDEDGTQIADRESATYNADEISLLKAVSPEKMVHTIARVTRST